MLHSSYVMLPVGFVITLSINYVIEVMLFACTCTVINFVCV